MFKYLIMKPKYTNNKLVQDVSWYRDKDVTAIEDELIIY